MAEEFDRPWRPWKAEPYMNLFMENWSTIATAEGHLQKERKRGINLDDEKLNNVDFSDDILLTSERLDVENEMLKKLSEAAKQNEFSS